jgi:hypothetical protein
MFGWISGGREEHLEIGSHYIPINNLVADKGWIGLRMALKTARSVTVAAGAILDPAKNVSNKLVTRIR